MPVALVQKGRFTAEAKAQAANAAKLGPLLPEFAEGLAQVIIVGRITTGKTARVEVLQHCVAIAEFWRAASVKCHRSESLEHRLFRRIHNLRQ